MSAIETIKAFLLGTPWWVYLLFFYLIKQGIAATTTRTVSLKKLVILPIVLSVWSIIDLIKFSHVTPGLFVMFMAGVVLGVWLGWIIVCRQRIAWANRAEYTLQISGNYSTLVVLLVVFGAKYFFGATMSENPHWLHELVPLYALFFISAVIVGVLFGRLANYAYQVSGKSH
ncbi:MAG: hypothetical protein COV52_05225 [Gammaproteobacteria bacterium CG11_big_fil_rev_8_21_14_0_20_46_22]|nr:MAG: hypothetical protein COW05_10030 [Gammaproteobacteria bacterium CG12_big_fil_rev_8_21_14_0_65_46_12]PIR11198.1 MAG: hypothetical protein COV52_05225 [Gammaproteobacteria bacterium CG11_big_fil_rev_8_21_14_0_20_46_22]